MFQKEMTHAPVQETDVLLLLEYFAIFRHPLLAEEIIRFSGSPEEAVRLQLTELVSCGVAYHIDRYYLLRPDRDWVEKRIRGEQLAGQLLPKAVRCGKLIAAFPFVRFVGISGSLSKRYADEKTDFDFFIITSSNALWICRTLLHLFKKLTFLAGLQHHFCMNYFIDENHLELEEKNIFTQIELSTLIPLGDEYTYHRLLFANRKSLPNINRLSPLHLQAAGSSNKEKNQWLKWLNHMLMKWTDSKWKAKWKQKGYPMDDYGLAFKTSLYVSKNHPRNFQKKVLAQLAKNTQH